MKFTQKATLRTITMADFAGKASREEVMLYFIYEPKDEYDSRKRFSFLWDLKHAEIIPASDRTYCLKGQYRSRKTGEIKPVSYHNFTWEPDDIKYISKEVENWLKDNEIEEYVSDGRWYRRGKRRDGRMLFGQRQLGNEFLGGFYEDAVLLD